jgi:TolB-like protein
MADVFLSYSREDQATARQFADGLQRTGLSVWWDQALRSGEAYDRVTEQALEDARAVVVLWSRTSVDSRWVRTEATQADRSAKLVPVMIEPCKRPIMFDLTHTADLYGWQGNPSDPRWISFVDDLRVTLGGKSVAPDIAAAPAVASPASRKWGAGSIVGASLILAAMVGGATWLLRHHGAEGAQTAATLAAAEPTLAVLPFANLSSDPEQEYFADGITEELLNSLAGIRGLQVTGRTSSFYFKGRNEDLKDIGQKLGVAHLLEGSVRKDGDQLRITAQLIKASDGFHLWSQTYNRPMKDIFQVQEDIAHSVAEAMQITLGVGDLGRAKGLTRDVEAYQAYLEGRALEGVTSPQETQRRRERLEFAVKRDPSFLFAWMYLADQYRGEALFASADPERNHRWRQKSEAARAEAIRLSQDPRLTQALEMNPLLPRGKWIELERGRSNFEAVFSDPHFAPMAPRPSVVDLFLIGVDKASVAIEKFERHRTLDPLNQRIAVNLAEAYANAGRLEESQAERQRGMAIAKSSVLANATVLTAKVIGDRSALERGWEQLLPLRNSPGDMVPELYRLRDQPEEARAFLRRETAKPGGPIGTEPALWAAYFGDHDLALQMLKADTDPDRRFISALSYWRPIMAGVRRLPGFKEYLRETGLVDYWREYGWGEHCRPVGEDDFECT